MKAKRKIKKNSRSSLPSVATVCKDYPEYAPLIKAVIREIGIEAVEDVNNSGADAGFGGFTYTNDTHKFAMKYQKYIIALLENTADQLGDEVVSMVKNFGMYGGSMDKEELRELYAYLSMSKKLEQGGITNTMAWFALEEVCRMFER